MRCNGRERLLGLQVLLHIYPEDAAGGLQAFFGSVASQAQVLTAGEAAQSTLSRSSSDARLTTLLPLRSTATAGLSSVPVSDTHSPLE